jgi:hypothetical protein
VAQEAAATVAKVVLRLVMQENQVFRAQAVVVVVEAALLD